MSVQHDHIRERLQAVGARGEDVRYLLDVAGGVLTWADVLAKSPGGDMPVADALWKLRQILDSDATEKGPADV